jgi:hypothetical protein
MAKPSKQELIISYKRVLVRMEAEGNPQAEVQRRLIARLQREVDQEVQRRG